MRLLVKETSQSLGDGVRQHYAKGQHLPAAESDVISATGGRAQIAGSMATTSSVVEGRRCGGLAEHQPPDKANGLRVPGDGFAGSDGQADESCKEGFVVRRALHFSGPLVRLTSLGVPWPRCPRHGVTGADVGRHALIDTFAALPSSTRTFCETSGGCSRRPV